ncbi:pleckstrin-like domain-containing family F member 1-like [Scleropages formosus]|uniref:Pleckstrin-like domain-containing family F member 1-like n=1 Tax=Scleropages formosus TaxID=113540 RepID=A0A0P7Y6Z1_SCLFO|nr:pleckstrin homology domain-containing family F member 1 [Scleropages formosus]KPP61479.1 pleckstrin-like domain-containing family F member 1-like [Scleropages formosus]
MNRLAFTVENAERIAAVESRFGPFGKPLAKPGRALVGEGQLMKLCRRRPQPRMFFLFNDILVYGSSLLSGRWCQKQQVIALEDVVLEDLEDGLEMKNQWLIRTPRKSFYVSAASPLEKNAWIEHILECHAQRLQMTSAPSNGRLAAAWVPDWASAICMRCSSRFTVTHRRHHCRQCGFVVCSSCSRSRFVLENISRKPVRVCCLCFRMLQAQDEAEGRGRGSSGGSGGSDGKNWSDDEYASVPMHEESSDEDSDEEDMEELQVPQKERHMSWSPYVLVSDYQGHRL